MKRYQILIQEHADKGGIRPLSRALDMPVQSLSNYLLDGTEPRTGNLEKMSKFFGEPISSLIMEVGQKDSIENQIIEAMGKLTKEKKKATLAYMRGL